MVNKIPAVIALITAIVLNPVSADQEKSSQEIGGLSIVDFHQETLTIPYVFVKNLGAPYDGQCFAVDMVQNGSANTWKVDTVEIAECPPEAAALNDKPDESPPDSPGGSNSNDELGDDDSGQNDPKEDESSPEDLVETDSLLKITVINNSKTEVLLDLATGELAVNPSIPPTVTLAPDRTATVYSGLSFEVGPGIPPATCWVSNFLTITGGLVVCEFAYSGQSLVCGETPVWNDEDNYIEGTSCSMSKIVTNGGENPSTVTITINEPATD